MSDLRDKIARALAEWQDGPNAKPWVHDMYAEAADAVLAVIDVDAVRAEASKIEGRALEAEAAIELVREAATEVTNQGNNQGRTHYENCWKHHLHCLAAKILHETGEDDE